MNREHSKQRGWLGWGLLAAIVALVALALPLGGGGAPVVATQEPGDCNTGVNVFSLALIANPTTAQPGDTIKLDLTLENINGAPCDVTSLDVAIGRDAAGVCQEAGGALDVILTNVDVPQNALLTSADPGFGALNQTCTLPLDAKGNFVIHAEAAGELHTGTLHVSTGDERNVLVIVVDPELTVTKSCVNDPIIPGDPALWEIVVTNTSNGNVTILVDEVVDKGLVIAGDFELATGEFLVIPHENEKTADDLAQGFIENQAAAFGVITAPGELEEKLIEAESNVARCTNVPVKPNIVKYPRLANLWLCNTGADTCDNKETGVEEVNFELRIDDPITSREPKCVAAAELAGTDPTECEFQTVGSLEFEVRYDPKFITLSVDPAPGIEGMECFSSSLEGIFQVACVTEGKPETAPRGPVTIAVLHVRPTADVYKLMIPNQENGIVTELINQNCQLSDLQGHPIKTDVCENAAITIRYLEGDVHADCVIDVLDQQQIAFRWGAQLGNLLYSARYDLEPSFPKADGDIDAKDLQFVYGRHGDPTSTCKNPHPDQDPVDPQVKIDPPLE